MVNHNRLPLKQLGIWRRKISIIHDTEGVKMGLQWTDKQHKRKIKLIIALKGLIWCSCGSKSSTREKSN